MADRIDTLKIVCLGGGVGTSNLLRGIKHHNPQLTVITSMADDGGSSGRLRKAYDIMPPGDIIYCIASLIPNDQEELEDLLLYRFPGENEDDKSIEGHKLGNLIMLAEIQRTGDFYKAIQVTKKLFGVTADLLPATDEHVQLCAITNDGREVTSETTLDLALYSEPYGLKNIFIKPNAPKVNPKVVEALMQADVIISGPGDLYTNQLPVLVVPEIKEAVLESSANKIFIANIANKPFETKGFMLNDFVHAISDHLGTFPFNSIILNNNISLPMPAQYKYEYIRKGDIPSDIAVIEEDVVNAAFPIYHDPFKLAKAVIKAV